MNKFFQLIQIALGERSAFTETPTCGEWIDMMDMAKRQALIGFCAMGIERLPESQRPRKEQAVRWAFMVGKIEQRNRWMNQKCGEMTDLLSSAGFRSYILKGQGIATLYPEPLRRQSGDIDVWVIPEDKQNADVSSYIDKVVGYAKRLCPATEATYHHVDIEIATERMSDGRVEVVPVNGANNIEVEIHYRFSWFCSPLRNRRLQRWFAEHRHCMRKSPDGTFSMPTNEFNIIFILVHIYRHLFDEGIGLRQFLDYYYVVMEWRQCGACSEDMGGLLRHLGLYKFCGAVMYVLHEVFCLETRYMIVPMNKKEGAFLLNEIIHSGNFGQYDGVQKKGENLMHRFIRRQRRNLRFLLKYPEEIMWVPLWIVGHRIWRRWKGYIA